MQLLRLTVFSLLLFAFATGLASCEKDAEKNKTILYSKSDIAMTGAQAVPVSASSATGTLAVLYSKASHGLSYTFSWTGLSAPPNNISIYGPAPVGYGSTTVKQAILTAANPTTFPATGSYSGSLYVDETVVKEEDLLNYLYYISIRTPSYPGGEIRGQIRFQ